MDRASDITVVVGTPDGVRVVGQSDGAGLDGRNVTALAAGAGNWWTITNSKVVWRGGLNVPWEQVAALDGLSGECLLPVDDQLFVGASEARLLRLNGSRLETVAGFDAVDGRDSWYTPWGGPADSRSMTADGDGNLYVNVHVGGVVKSTDRGESWQPAGLDIHADAHQVLAGVTASGLVFAATARGLAVSRDSGVSWSVESEGMHSRYCRAVAATSEHVLVSASDGPGGRNACLYRRGVESAGPFEKCAGGLPDWFSDNIDTGLLAARDRFAAFGMRDGRVFTSEDEGAGWRLIEQDRSLINCVVVTPDER